MRFIDFLDKNMTGVYITHPPPLPGGEISADVIRGKNMRRGREKGIRGKKNQRKKKEKKGKERKKRERKKEEK